MSTDLLSQDIRQYGYKKLYGFSKGGNKLPGYFSQAGNASALQKHYRRMR